MEVPASSPKLIRNEESWALLSLPGERPVEWGPDPAEPGSRHCVRLMARQIMRALKEWPGSPVEALGPWVIEANAVWEELGYGSQLASLDGRYTRWVSERMALRSQTSAIIPMALKKLAQQNWSGGALVAPGRVWRRDLRDKTHIGAPRQMDIWILRPGWEPNRKELSELVRKVMRAASADAQWIEKQAEHPYTTEGVEVEVVGGDKNLEVLECGLASKALLKACGMEGWGGLALGLGLDRMCMVAKRMSDIRWLDDPDPRAKEQMEHLEPWKDWSRQPGCYRDISVAVSASMDAEQVVDKAAQALSHPEWLDGIDVLGCWASQDVHERARDKLGMNETQKNWLIRLRLRDWRQSIPREQADEQARRAWDALHEGSARIYRPGGD